MADCRASWTNEIYCNQWCLDVGRLEHSKYSNYAECTMKSIYAHTHIYIHTIFFKKKNITIIHTVHTCFSFIE